MCIFLFRKSQTGGSVDTIMRVLNVHADTSVAWKDSKCKFTLILFLFWIWKFYMFLASLLLSCWVKKTWWQHSEECMCCLRNIAMRDYQEIVTIGQTDTRTHRKTPDKVIAMCRYASQATQKDVFVKNYAPAATEAIKGCFLVTWILPVATKSKFTTFSIKVSFVEFACQIWSLCQRHTVTDRQDKH